MLDKSKKVRFDNVEINDEFYHNGIRYMKSSRSLSFDIDCCVWVHFDKDEEVTLIE